MVNETKVKWMTKAAMVKKKEERGMFITSRFYGDDYVSFQVIKAVLGVSFGFVLVVALWFMENSEVLLTACSVEELFSDPEEYVDSLPDAGPGDDTDQCAGLYFAFLACQGSCEGVYLQPEKDTEDLSERRKERKG